MPPLDDEAPSRRLKAATAVLHQRVEDGVDILRRTETLAGYAELLKRMLGFYEGIEPRLRERLGPETPRNFLVERTPRLRADLKALAEWREGGAVFPLPPFESRHHALGGLYVVEGAALGGQIIARHLFARLGLTAERGASFFASGGDPVGPRWKAFRSLLDETEDYGAVEAGAVATFLAFERCVVVREVALA